MERPLGALMIHVPNDIAAQVLSFVRQDVNGEVIAVFNFSDKAPTVRFQETLYRGAYADADRGPGLLGYWLIGLSGVHALIQFTHRDCLDL